ncbi:MAG TPA: hypothetical protein ENG66_02550 [Thermococcus sp.]|nr:hypothetical protein [Thermococcus sp.]
MGLAELFEFQVSPPPPEEAKEKREVRRKEAGKKTKLLITLTANALMLLTAFVAYFYFAETVGATIAILGVVAVWAVVFHLLRSKNLIDELIENVLIVAIVGVMVIVTLLNWGAMETPFREIMVAGGILIVGVSFRDLLKFWKEYGGVKMATSVINESNFRFFRRVG